MIPSNTTYWTLDEGPKEIELTKEQLSLLTSNLLEIKSRDRNGYGLLLRGVSEEYLNARFKTANDHDFSLGKLLSRLYYFGEKAKYFFDDRSMGNSSPVVESIEDKSSSVARKIFDRIGSLPDSPDKNIQGFVKNNPRFFMYFKEPGNAAHFSELIESNSGAVRDYYLCILHRAGYYGIGRRSIGVSASENLKTAFRFSRGDFIIYFVARGRFLGRSFRSRHRFLPSNAPVLELDTDIFPDQKESTVFGAVLAHNILGVLDQKRERFFANPHLFSGENRNRYIADRPLKIDQSNFDELVQGETNYYGYIFTHDHEHYGEARL